MINESKKKQLADLIAGLSSVEISWISGYLADIAGTGAVSVAQTIANLNKIQIYYATETQNSQNVAQAFALQLKANGWIAKVASIRDATIQKLAIAADPVVFVTSTHGEGDPPEMARKFFTVVKNCTESNKLIKLKFFILGLGDKSYQKFCQTALDLEEELVKLGAVVLQETTLLDVDYNSHVPAWISLSLKTLNKESNSALPNIVLANDVNLVSSEPEVGTNRLSTVKGKIVHKVNLNDRGSNKETWHIEIDLETAVAFKPGDAVGIVIPQDVIEIHHRNFGRNGNTSKTEPARLYSVANSPITQGEKSVHLTVALATYQDTKGKLGFGLCSNYLKDLPLDSIIDCYIHRNPRFKLPSDSTKDIIMVGPGTGVAPFRGFMQERVDEGATGRNWLFFGDQHLHCDFLYQAEFLELLAGGALTKLDVAFSRDQPQKIYVQHKIKEQADEFAEWIRNGALLYLCGSKTPMSEDVENTIAEILGKKILAKNDRSKMIEAGNELLTQMSEEGRYLKDVY